MKLLDSLYLRLALVLLLALGASYGTMYTLFLSQLDDSRETNFARTIAAQVRLIEEFLETRPARELPALNGLLISATPPAVTPDDAERVQRALQIKQRLGEELGRPVTVISSLRPSSGLWIDLQPTGRATQWLFLSTPKPHRRRSDSLASALLVGFLVFFIGGMFLLWQVQRPLKRLVMALESIGPATPPEKLTIGGVGISRVLLERYNEMADRLRRHEEERGIMLAGVAHDLRSPITRLRLLLELQRGERHAELNQNLDEIERITEQFLLFARGYEDEAALNYDLKQFVQEVAAPYREQSVTVTGEAEDCIVAIRPNALRRALINLIENALEYGLPPIVARIQNQNDGIVIAIEDAGSGIAENDMASATRPFTRLDNSRGGKGHCGLGLSIAAKVAAAHQGSMVLRNLRPSGFAAEIHLPATEGQPAA